MYSVIRLLSGPSCSLFTSKLSSSGVHLFSNISKSSKPKTQPPPLKIQSETGCIASLFNEITNILGADALVADKTASGSSKSKVTDISSVARPVEESNSCSQSVCENATQEREGNKLEKQVDVSPIVCEIAKIVRSENYVVPMEQRLAEGGFKFTPEIVDKVLKRCFKASHLALRFFNWIKRNEGILHSRGTYNTMLYIAVEAKDSGLVEELVKEMEENSFEKDVRTWTILVSRYGESKMIGKALSVFEEMRKHGCEPDAVAYKTLIRSLCKTGKGEVALEFYREMAEKGMFLDLKLYKMLLNCIARTEDAFSLRSIADDMMRVCHISEQVVYSCLLKSLSVSGRIRQVLELIRELRSKEVPVDAKHFEILVKGLCKSGRTTDAVEIFEIMKRKNLVDGNSYATVINGYLKEKEISKALDLFQSMKQSGHSPTISTYTELMLHLFKFNRYEKGREIFNELIENGVELDAIAIMAMVTGHLHQDQISQAWKLFNSMEEKGIKPTWKCYSIMVKELCRLSRTEEILKVLNQMQASKIAVGNEMFHWIVACLKRNGEMDKINRVKQVVKNHKPCWHEDKVPCTNAVTEKKRCAGLNNHCPEQMRPVRAPDEQAVQEICAILSSSKRWRTIEEILEKCAVYITPELVVEVLRRCMMNGNAAMHFFSWVGKREGYTHTTETYNEAIKTAGRGKDFKQMRNLYYEMQRRGCLVTSDTWTIMIMQYGRAGLTEIVLRTFEEMKASGFKPDGATYKCLITVLCGRKGSKVDEAIKMFQEMINAEFVPDRELAEAYINCLCGVGDLETAKAGVGFLCKVGFSVPLAYSIYIRALCQEGRVEDALRVLDEVKTERTILERYTYGSIFHGLLKKGKAEEALAKMESMKQLGTNPTVHVYTSLILHFFKEKQIKQALDILHKMKQNGCVPSVVTYTAMICGYMNIGMIEEAWSVFHTMKDKGPLPDFITYSRFISCLCEARKSEDGLNLLSQMLDKGIIPSTINFNTVLFGLNREGKRDLARVVVQKKSALLNRRKSSLCI